MIDYDTWKLRSPDDEFKANDDAEFCEICQANGATYRKFSEKIPTLKSDTLCDDCFKKAEQIIEDTATEDGGTMMAIKTKD